MCFTVHTTGRPPRSSDGCTGGRSASPRLTPPRRHKSSHRRILASTPPQIVIGTPSPPHPLVAFASSLLSLLNPSPPPPSQATHSRASESPHLSMAEVGAPRRRRLELGGNRPHVCTVVTAATEARRGSSFSITLSCRWKDEDEAHCDFKGMVADIAGHTAVLRWDEQDNTHYMSAELTQIRWRQHQRRDLVVVVPVGECQIICNALTTRCDHSTPPAHISAQTKEQNALMCALTTPLNLHGASLTLPCACVSQKHPRSRDGHRAVHSVPQTTSPCHSVHPSSRRRRTGSSPPASTQSSLSYRPHARNGASGEDPG